MTTYEEAFQSHYALMLKFATRLTKCEHKAKDLLQDAAIRAFKHQDKLDDMAKFKSWFSTILYNTFINNYRKMARRRELLEATSGRSLHFFHQSKDYNQGLEKLKADDIHELSANVGPNSFAAFKLFLKGYSYKEISRKLNIAVGTVKSRIHFARTRMKVLTRQHQIAV